jgi:D-alanyl-D-alanine carboxypeptidase
MAGIINKKATRRLAFSSRAVSPWRVILLRLLAAMALVTIISCTLDITVPVEPPPDAWDPALNTHPDGQVFQALLNRYAREGLPGVVLLVRTPHGQWNGAAGYARIESRDRMQPTHRHYAASVTKMYIATAVLLLAEDGLINLDAAISQYLPEAVYGRVPNGAAATVRQLLGHTSGIPDFNDVLAYELDTLNDPMGSYPPDRLLSYLEDESAFCAPGACYFYSNTNYLLLALLMDHVTGASHAQVISERIIQALGLDATYYKNEPGYPAPPGLVNSYHDLEGDGRIMNVSDMTVHFNGMFIGNTGLIATSADFASFIEALLGGSLIGEESLAEMQERTESSFYGLGLSFIETPYGPGLGHDGGDMGILADVRHFPGLGATIVLLANAGNGGLPETLFNQLWDEALRVALEAL